MVCLCRLLVTSTPYQFGTLRGHVHAQKLWNQRLSLVLSQASDRAFGKKVDDLFGETLPPDAVWAVGAFRRFAAVF